MKSYRELVFQQYRAFGLDPWLDLIRTDGRYPGKQGVNVLVNACLDEGYDDQLVLRELTHATTSPGTFTSILESGRQGISYGLNPYTDWSLSRLSKKPERWVVILGLDYYSIGGLNLQDWLRIREDPFSVYDPYWFQLWRWILGHFDADSVHHGRFSASDGIKSAAEAFLQTFDAGLIFHNAIPYLRPAHVLSSDDKGQWEKNELRNKKAMADCYADVAELGRMLQAPMRIYCTRQDVKDGLVAAGIPEAIVTPFGAHPSKASFPGVAKRLRFSGDGLAA